MLVILHMKIYCFTDDLTYAQILNDLLLSFVVGEFSDKNKVTNIYFYKNDVHAYPFEM